jgi:hypothetical protein
VYHAAHDNIKRSKNEKKRFMIGGPVLRSTDQDKWCTGKKNG